MFNISTNLSEFKRELIQKGKSLEKAQRKAMSEATRSLFVASKNQLVKLVYQVEIPKRANGKPRWKRKMRAGGILGAERMSVTTSFRRMAVEGQIFTDPNSEPGKPIKNYPGGYAERRHKRDGKYTNAAPWRERAFDEGKARAISKYRESIAKDLR